MLNGGAMSKANIKQANNQTQRMNQYESIRVNRQRVSIKQIL